MAIVLRGLTLRNFRAFKAQNFSFSKFNIFVGPNNSGKSSAISALNLLAQTYGNPEVTGSPLILNGQFDRLGTYLDLVHGNRSNTPLGIDFQVDSFELRMDFKYRQQRREIELVKFDLDESGRSIINYSTRKDSFSVRISGKDIETILPNVRKRRPRFYRLAPLSGFSGLTFPTNDQNGPPEDIALLLRNTERQISRARTRIGGAFSGFDSLSPFRDRPERTYLYSGEVAQKIGSTGSNMALMLASDTSKRGAESLDMIGEISRWFKVTDIAEEIRIKSLTPRHFEIVLVDRNGHEQNICDVGFGCSQVLPVLAASLNLYHASGRAMPNARPILVVQEPEIHLHPNAQAALGSFFSRIVKNDGQLFVETHSDNLVLRVARHVADGILAPDDVRIFFVRKIDGYSQVEQIDINEHGAFKPEWPGGFFPQRQSESLSLARAAYQSTAGTPHQAQFDFKYPEEANKSA